MSFKYYNPVQIYFHLKLEEALKLLIKDELKDARIMLISSHGWLRRGIGKRIESVLKKQLVYTLSEINPNPEFTHLQALKNTLQIQYDAIIALGGGSVLDSAKFFALQSCVRIREKEICIGNDELDSKIHALPIYAFPTTAGTSSELTQWATLWDSNAQLKYSLSHSMLYPKMAFYDIDLLSSLPKDIMLHTTLDSLSHACESIWNKNANFISSIHAVQAIELIITYLACLYKDMSNMHAREELVRASIHAGLAFSNTQTALAHAISYPITMRFGVPHGLACSFTLPLLCECITDKNADSLLQPYKAAIKELFVQVGVSERAGDYGLDSIMIQEIFNSLNARAKNGLLDIKNAQKLLEQGMF